MAHSIKAQTHTHRIRIGTILIGFILLFSDSIFSSSTQQKILAAFPCDFMSITLGEKKILIFLFTYLFHFILFFSFSISSILFSFMNLNDILDGVLDNNGLIDENTHAQRIFSRKKKCIEMLMNM